MANQIKSIGRIPLNIDPDLHRILTALKERAEILFGERAPSSGNKYQSYGEITSSLTSINQSLEGKAETIHGHETYYEKTDMDRKLTELKITDLENVGINMDAENVGKLLFFGHGNGKIELSNSIKIKTDESITFPKPITFKERVTLDESGIAFKDISVSGLFLSEPIAPAVAAGLIPVFAAGNCIGRGFDGAGALEELHGEISLPGEYLEGSDIIPFISWMPAVAAAGNVKWQLEYSWQNVGAAFSAPTTINAVSASSGMAWQPERTAFAAVSGSGMLVRSKIVFRIFRDSSDGSDTYGSDAVILDVGLTIQVDGFGMASADAK